MTTIDLDALDAAIDAAAVNPGVRETIDTLFAHIREQEQTIARLQRTVDAVRGLPDGLLEVRDRVAGRGYYDGRAAGRASAYEDSASRLRNILATLDRTA